MTLVISKGITLDNGTRAAAIAGVSPTLDYRFAREKREIETVSLTDKLTYTGGNGTFVGSDGFIQPATTNVPRFDHDPVTGESLGLLVEESRTNLIVGSEKFNVSPWINSGATITPNAGIAPNGTTTATRVQDVASATLRVVAGTTEQRKSIYARATSESGTVAILGHAAIAKYIVTLTETWQRFDFSIDTTETGGTSIYAVDFRAGTLKDVLIWGAQLEAASTPSTYIPTTTTAVTRTADSAVIDGTGVITGTYTMVEKPAGCAVVSGTNINLQPGFTAERVMVFPAALDAGQITAIRGAM